MAATAETIRQAIATGTEQLSAVTDTPRLDAELLLAHVLKCPRIDLFKRALEPIPPKAKEQFSALIEKRQDYLPVAYLTGFKEFWGLKLEVTPDVLIPRPDTEILVEKALEIALSFERKVDIADLGTGSGCIALALARSLKERGRDFHIYAVDYGEQVLAVARRNVQSHGYAEQISVLPGDWLSCFQEGADFFDLILTNPPYIAEGEKNISPELRYEPPRALYAGSDGLDDLKYLLEISGNYLRRGGYFLSEIGHDQASKIKELVQQLTLAEKTSLGNLSVVQDLAGRDRVIILRDVMG